MYLTSTLRQTLAIGGVSLMAVVGLIGWTRHENPPSAAPANEFGEPNRAMVYGPSPFSAVQPAIYTDRAAATAPYAAASAPIVQNVVARRRYHTRRGRRRVIVRRRPFSHSAAIVAGSAAGGALIGGLAGGGKGAGIGALVGGGGGLVYDRLTHKKRVVVRR
jgi:hypothetical protein